MVRGILLRACWAHAFLGQFKWSVKSNAKSKPQVNIGNCVIVNRNRNYPCKMFHAGAGLSQQCSTCIGLERECEGRKSARAASPSACCMCTPHRIRAGFKIYFLSHNLNVTGSCISLSILFVLFYCKISMTLAWIMLKDRWEGCWWSFLLQTLFAFCLQAEVSALCVRDKWYPKPYKKCMCLFFFWS